MKDLLFKAYELEINIKFSPISESEYNSWVSLQGKNRYIITILSRQITARQIGEVTRVVAEQGLNIDARPQLEIYADDVRCSHGATVGQMEDEAILYMRQRGLKEEQARRLQIEGFAADVVGRCRIEAVKEILTDAVVRHLDKI